MKIAIVGPGAMGLLFGVFLSKSKEDVHILDHNPKRAEHIRKQGVKVEGITSFSARLDASSNPKDIGDADLVIICVKSYDTEDCLCAPQRRIDNVKRVVCTWHFQSEIHDDPT